MHKICLVEKVVRFLLIIVLLHTSMLLAKEDFFNKELLDGQTKELRMAQQNELQELNKKFQNTKEVNAEEKYAQEYEKIKNKYKEQDKRWEKWIESGLEPTGSKPKDVLADGDFTGSAEQITKYRDNLRKQYNEKGKKGTKYVIDYGYKVVDLGTDLTIWRPNITEADREYNRKNADKKIIKEMKKELACSDKEVMERAKIKDMDAFSTPGGQQSSGITTVDDDLYGKVLDNEMKYRHALESDDYKTMGKSLDKMALPPLKQADPDFYEQAEKLKNYKDPFLAGIINKNDSPEVRTKKINLWKAKAEAHIQANKRLAKKMSKEAQDQRKDMVEELKRLQDDQTTKSEEALDKAIEHIEEQIQNIKESNKAIEKQNSEIDKKSKVPKKLLQEAKMELHNKQDNVSKIKKESKGEATTIEKLSTHSYKLPSKDIENIKKILKQYSQSDKSALLMATGIITSHIDNYLVKHYESMTKNLPASQQLDIVGAKIDAFNSVLDFLDNTALGTLRSSGVVELSYGSLRKDAKVIVAINFPAIATINERLNKSILGDVANNTAFKAINFAQEGEAYYDAFAKAKSMTEGFENLATEIFRRRTPVGGIVESVVMENYVRAGIGIVYMIFPPTAIPEGIYGMTSSVALSAQAIYWDSEVELLVDGMYDKAKFKQINQKDKEMSFVLQSVEYKSRTFTSEELLSKNGDFIMNNDVDDMLWAKLHDLDPFLTMLQELQKHPLAGQKVVDKFTLQAEERWRSNKKNFIQKMIKKLENRRSADQLIDIGGLENYFNELMLIGDKLQIKVSIQRHIREEFNSGILKYFWQHLVDGKRIVLQEPLSQSEKNRYAGILIHYINGYKFIFESRQFVEEKVIAWFYGSTLTAPSTIQQYGVRLLTGLPSLTGEVEEDIKISRHWRERPSSIYNNVKDELQTIKSIALKKKIELEGDFDQEMLIKISYKSLWIEAFEKSKVPVLAAKNVKNTLSRMKKQREALLEEFKKHYSFSSPDINDTNLTMQIVVDPELKQDNLGNYLLNENDKVTLSVVVFKQKDSGNIRYQWSNKDKVLGESKSIVVYGKDLAGNIHKISVIVIDEKNLSKINEEKNIKLLTRESVAFVTVKGVTAKQLKVELAPYPAEIALNETLNLSLIEPSEAEGLTYEWHEWDGRRFSENIYSAKRSYGIPANKVGSDGIIKVKVIVKDKNGHIGEAITEDVKVVKSKEDSLAEEAIKLAEQKQMNNATKKWDWFEKEVLRYLNELVAKSEGEYGTLERKVILIITEKNGKQEDVDQCLVDAQKEAKALREMTTEAKNEHSTVLRQIHDNQGSPTKILKYIDDFVAKYKIPNSLKVSVSYSSPCVDSDEKNITKELKVKISGAKTITVSPKETVTLNAVVTGGKAPVEISWDGGNISPSGSQAIFTATTAGSYTVQVVAKDASGQSVSDSVSIKVVKMIEPSLSGLSDTVYYGTTQTIMVGVSGLPSSTKASGKIDCTGHKQTSNPFDECNEIIPYGSGASVYIAPADDREDIAPVKNVEEGEYEYIWQPSGDSGLEFDPPSGKEPRVAVTFGNLGEIEIWAEVLKDGKTVGESKRIKTKAIPPKFTLDISPSTSYIGDENKATITINPDIDNKYLNFRWLPMGNNIEKLGESNKGREYRFKTKNIKPSNIEVSIWAVPYAKQEIASLKQVVSAKPYKVDVKVLGTQGPKPMIWKEGKGLVAVDKEIAIHQNVRLVAQITPEPTNNTLRYSWKLNENSHFAGGESGREVMLNRSQIGTCVATVTVKDKDGNILGESSGSFSVTISQKQIDEGKKKAEDEKKARDLLEKGRALWKQGKLEEAIIQIINAEKLAPKDNNIVNTLKSMQNQKKDLDSKLKDAEGFINQDKLDKAEKVLVGASNISDKYEKYQEVLKHLTDAKKKAEEEKKQLAKLLKDAKALKSAGKLDEAVTLLKKSNKQFPDNQEVDKLLKEIQEQQNDALKKMTEGQGQWQNGLLDSAISTLHEATKIDPSNKQIAKVLEGMQGQKKILDGILSKAKQGIEQKEFEQAKSLLGKAGLISKNYPPYVEIMNKLETAQKKDEEEKRIAAEKIRQEQLAEKARKEAEMLASIQKIKQEAEAEKKAKEEVEKVRRKAELLATIRKIKQEAEVRKNAQEELEKAQRKAELLATIRKIKQENEVRKNAQEKLEKAQKKADLLAKIRKIKQEAEDRKKAQEKAELSAEIETLKKSTKELDNINRIKQEVKESETTIEEKAIAELSGVLSGRWSGKDRHGWKAKGFFKMHISVNGKVTGNYSGDTSGALHGFIDSSGNMNIKLGGGSVKGGSWRGSIRKMDGGGLAGSGSWSAQGYSGSWSGSGR